VREEENRREVINMRRGDSRINLTRKPGDIKRFGKTKKMKLVLQRGKSSIRGSSKYWLGRLEEAGGGKEVRVGGGNYDKTRKGE